jgi:PAS domain S-box-containing protein
VPLGILFAEAPSGRIVGGNARIEQIVGHPIIESASVDTYDAWVAYHDDGRVVAPHEYPLAKVLSGVREATLEAHYQRPDGTRVWIDIVGAQVRSPDGSIKGAVVAVSDIDARKRAEAMQTLMNQELSHRMKNQLAMVQAIARQTMRGATDLASMRETLSNRLVALGKAHDILLDGMMDRSPLSAVLRGGVGVHDDPAGRFVYEGPLVEINGRAVLPLSLMLHELSTNAAKYGALCGPEGLILIQWDVRGEGLDAILRIVWRETGGPPVASPERKGFGSWVIERGLTDQVGGTVALDFAAAGLTCTIQAPLRSFQQVV